VIDSETKKKVILIILRMFLESTNNPTDRDVIGIKKVAKVKIYGLKVELCPENMDGNDSHFPFTII
jgi:hypothetical protein